MHSALRAAHEMTLVVVVWCTAHERMCVLFVSTEDIDRNGKQTQKVV